MRRVILLLGLTVFVAWLGGIPAASDCGGLWGGTLRAAGFEETSPHWGCVDNQCVEIYECGVDDCSACPGCDPDEEWQCLNDGGHWNPDRCTCEPPWCDPWEEQECANQWGEWDPWTCTCSNACNPGEAVPVWGNSGEETSWCIDCVWGMIYHWDYTYYEQYCQDGRLWDSYSIETGWLAEGETWDCWDYCLLS